jgi:hypothetical protein
MSQFTYYQNQQGNVIPHQLSIVPTIPIQGQSYAPPPANTYTGGSINYSTIPAEYPVTSYSQSNLSTQYPPSQKITPQQMNIVPSGLNRTEITPIQYQPINPIPLNQQNAYQNYSKPTYNVGTPNVMVLQNEQNKILQGNLSNLIQYSNPTTNQQNIVQYNIFPQAINSFNAGNQSFAPNGMYLTNNTNINNGQFLKRENIMNQYGENKNNININSGLQNLNINNDKNTNAKVSEENKTVGLIEVSKVKKIQFECPVCHEEYDRSQFFGGRKEGDYFSSSVLYCKSCNKSIYCNDFCFKCNICHSYFCDDCAINQ